jgi:hypothetical protein
MAAPQALWSRAACGSARSGISRSASAVHEPHMPAVSDDGFTWRTSSAHIARWWTARLWSYGLAIRGGDITTRRTASSTTSQPPARTAHILTCVGDCARMGCEDFWWFLGGTGSITRGVINVTAVGLWSSHRHRTQGGSAAAQCGAAAPGRNQRRIGADWLMTDPSPCAKEVGTNGGQGWQGKLNLATIRGTWQLLVSNNLKGTCGTRPTQTQDNQNHLNSPQQLIVGWATNRARNRLRRTPGNGLPVGRPFRADRDGPEGPSYVTNG